MQRNGFLECDLQNQTVVVLLSIWRAIECQATTPPPQDLKTLHHLKCQRYAVRYYCYYIIVLFLAMIAIGHTQLDIDTGRDIDRHTHTGSESEFRGHVGAKSAQKRHRYCVIDRRSQR